MAYTTCENTLYPCPLLYNNTSEKIQKEQLQF